MDTLGALIGEELGHSLDVITERREVGIRIKRGIALLDQHVKIFGKDRERYGPAFLAQKGGNDSLTFPIKVFRRVMGPLGETTGLVRVRHHLHHASLHSYFVNVFRKLAKLATI